MPVFIANDVVLQKKLNVSPVSRESLLFLIDFDFTITRKYDSQGQRCGTCFSILEQSPPLRNDTFVSKSQEMSRFYRTMEEQRCDEPSKTHSSSVRQSKREAMAMWTTQSLENLRNGELTHTSMFEAVHRSALLFRSGWEDFVRFVHDSKVDMFIFSAGIKNVIELLLNRGSLGGIADPLHSNTFIFQGHKIHSNELIFGKCTCSPPTEHCEEKLTSWTLPIVSPMNKNAQTLLDVHPNLNDKKIVVVVGDSVDDIQMSSGLDSGTNGHLCTFIQIAFLNDVSESNIQTYMNAGWDIVLTEEHATFDYVLRLFDSKLKKVNCSHT